MRRVVEETGFHRHLLSVEPDALVRLRVVIVPPDRVGVMPAPGHLEVVSRRTFVQRQRPGIPSGNSTPKVSCQTRSSLVAGAVFLKSRRSGEVVSHAHEAECCDVWRNRKVVIVPDL